MSPEMEHARSVDKPVYMANHIGKLLTARARSDRSTHVDVG
jgi:hypothetical protein